MKLSITLEEARNLHQDYYNLVNYPSKNVLTYMINLTTLPWGEKYEECSDKFLPSDRQFPNTLARGSKDGVGDCWHYRGYNGLSNSSRW